GLGRRVERVELAVRADAQVGQRGVAPEGAGKREAVAQAGSPEPHDLVARPTAVAVEVEIYDRIACDGVGHGQMEVDVGIAEDPPRPRDVSAPVDKGV